MSQSSLVAIVFDNLESDTGLVRATTLDASRDRIDPALGAPT